MSKIDEIPKIHIIVRADTSSENGSDRYWWSVTMMASDATGKRSLGYRGTGNINSTLTDLKFESGPEVHDEKLPRWTPMNPTDRHDIRKKMIQLAMNAAEKLRKSGEETFEYLVP